jgi:hypothetical protein
MGMVGKLDERKDGFSSGRLYHALNSGLKLLKNARLSARVYERENI